MSLEVDLQSWSLLVNSVCDRHVPYEALTEVDQISDRLALEKLEFILNCVDQHARDQIIGVIHKKMSENDID